MWLLQQLNPESNALNLPLTLRMTGQLDQAALQRSLNEIVRRHATLRTALVAVDGQPTQLITPSLNLSLQVTDLRDLADTDRPAKALAVINEATLRAFDLTQAPLMRALLIQTRRCRLHPASGFAPYHLRWLVDDGAGARVERALRAFVSGRPSPLPELAIQYADFCRWQRQVLQGDEFADQVAYWHKQLQGSPPSIGPADRSPAPRRSIFSRRAGGRRIVP